ncbi:MAG: phosphoenolpyruvate carboxykinase (ATP), partial [Planctomycetaceae bacterium]|nr:phosphoenolpyruvate carboxykinase (ATP) [Planctomycetaceae bacterium]
MREPVTEERGPAVTNKLDLSQHGINVDTIYRNLVPAELYAHAIRLDEKALIADTGALIAYSGSKTGRSPKDKRIVRDANSENDVWWGAVNVAIDMNSFHINLERAIDYLNTRKFLYVIDAFAGWDPAYQMKIRVICSRPYHALFMHTMLIRPTAEQLRDFGEPDAVIYNAGAFPANRHTSGMTSKTSIDLHLETKEMVILGTEYAGEMKKGVFTMMNYFGPKQGILSMHCSATADKQTGRS